MCKAGKRGARRDGGDKHNRSTIVVHEVIRRCPGHLPRPDQVVADHGFEALVGDIAGGRDILAAGIVHQNIQLPIVLLDPPHRSFDTVFVAGVSGHDKGLAPRRPDHFGGLFQRLFAAREQRKPCPASGHFDRRRPAHSRSGPRDQGNLARHEIRRVTP